MGVIRLRGGGIAMRIWWLYGVLGVKSYHPDPGRGQRLLVTVGNASLLLPCWGGVFFDIRCLGFFFALANVPVSGYNSIPSFTSCICSRKLFHMRP